VSDIRTASVSVYLPLTEAIPTVFVENNVIHACVFGVWHCMPATESNSGPSIQSNREQKKQNKPTPNDVQPRTFSIEK
jgi:hypothetical protein